MQSLSLNQLFGEGAFQDANILVIQKTSLLRLSPSASNTAESLLVAILITALGNFKGTITDENNQAITDENNQALIFDNSEQFEFLKAFLWKPFLIRANRGSLKINQIIVNKYEISSNEYD